MVATSAQIADPGFASTVSRSEAKVLDCLSAANEKAAILGGPGMGDLGASEQCGSQGGAGMTECRLGLFR